MTSNLELPEMFQKIAQDNFPETPDTPRAPDVAAPLTPDTKATPEQPTPAATTPTAQPLASQMADQLAQANEAIAALAKEYPVWAARDIVKMNQALQDARSLTGDKRENLIRKDLFKIAHNAKGQGATFGYPLITDIGEHLCRYIERVPEIQADEMAVIRTHINAMDTVLKQKLTGNGGETGQELLNQIMNT